MKKLSQNDYVVSQWSGGKTTQIAICPPEAVYANRDFLWRVSSATVELPESDFTPLPDYDRLIATLRGEIVLSHNGGAPLSLRSFEVHAFSGADATHSTGCCRDFNLMLRRGYVTGIMETLRLTKLSCSFPAPCAEETVLLYCAEGSCIVEPHSPCLPKTDDGGFLQQLASGETFFMTEPVRLTLTGPAVLMVCRISPVSDSTSNIHSHLSPNL